MVKFKRSSAVKRLVDGEWVSLTEAQPLRERETHIKSDIAGMKSWQLPPRHQMPEKWVKGVKNWTKDGFAVMDSAREAREFTKHTEGRMEWND